MSEKSKLTKLENKILTAARRHGDATRKFNAIQHKAFKLQQEKLNALQARNKAVDAFMEAGGSFKRKEELLESTLKFFINGEK